MLGGDTMKISDVVRIKDISANKENHRRLICLVIKVEKSPMFLDSNVCVIQSSTERLRYHEKRLELINAVH